MNQALRKEKRNSYMRELRLAQPVWADKKKIAEFYELAKRLTSLTGIKYSVDHIIPIQGESVSGLHCEYNLQVITVSGNSRKGNKL